MNASALILAAHGSRHQPSVNRWISKLAQEVGTKLNLNEAVATFHQGTPTYEHMLDDIRSSTAVIVPFMSSEGYYCNRVLPEQLAKNARFNQIEITITPPIGIHAKLPSLVASRARQIMSDHELVPSLTTITIVGHGSARTPQSRLATERLAAMVRDENNMGHVIEAFLDEQPSVESIIDRSPSDAIVVLPFLIGAGPHAAIDIPSRLGLKTTGQSLTDQHERLLDSAQAKSCSSGRKDNIELPVNIKFPIVEHLNGKLVICDAPVGMYPEMADLITDVARSACSVTTS